jgi:hypothetical protein
LADSYIKAEDSTNFAKVIEISNCAGKHDDLVRFLQMARKSLREPRFDAELAYAYAKTDCLHDVEDFLSMTNVADILEVGEKCFQAAKLLFISISNWVRLATRLSIWAKTKPQSRVLGKPASCFMFYLKVDADSFVQGLEAGVYKVISCYGDWGELLAPLITKHSINQFHSRNTQPSPISPSTQPSPITPPFMPTYAPHQADVRFAN